MMTKEKIEETINISYYANKRKVKTKTMTKSKVETINRSSQPLNYFTLMKL